MSWIVKNLDDNNVGIKVSTTMRWTQKMFIVGNDLREKHVFLIFAV